MITYHREEKTDKIFNVENSRLEIILKTTTTTELFFFTQRKEIKVY